jgi:hypothetical protein
MGKTPFIHFSGLFSLSSIAYVLLGATVVSAPEGEVSVTPTAQIRVVPVLHAAEEVVSKEPSLFTQNIHESAELLPVVDQKDIHPEHQALLNTVLNWLPPLCRDSLDHLVVRYDSKSPRGQATSRSLLLRGTLPNDELVAVLIHECGHIMDLGGLQGTARAGASAFPDGGVATFNNDPSVRFYRISWSNSEDQRADARPEDFVSGYAAHDPFEDFAETLLLYALHNAEFKELAKQNTALAQKYVFMRDEIFSSSFTFSPAAQKRVVSFGEERVWDVTKLAHGLAL